LPPRVPPVYANVRNYNWTSIKKSIKSIVFAEYTDSDSAEIQTITTDSQELNVEKFTFIQKGDTVTLKNSIKKITMKLKQENEELQLINIKTKEIFIGTSIYPTGNVEGIYGEKR
jgi:hypothetical protein